MGIERAINYRLVLRIAGTAAADRWGSDTGSLGYEEAKRLFNEKYQIISYDQLKDEILLSWSAKSKNLKNTKMTMSEVLNEEVVNEENRPLFNRVRDKTKEQNKENLLFGIPDEVVYNKDFFKAITAEVDSSFEKVMDAARNGEIDLKLKDKDIVKTLFSIEALEGLRSKLDIKEIDTDTFLEIVLKDCIKKASELDISLKDYNEDIALAIKSNFYAKLNTITTNKESTRKRAKESIFDKIEDGTIGNMPIKDFLTGYDEMIELYCVFDKYIKNIDEMIKFYNIESKYNVVFFINIALDLSESTALGKKDIADQVSKLALLDSVIYRSSKMKETVSRIIYLEDKEDKVYQGIINEIYEIVALKESIVEDLLLVKGLVFDNLKEEVFNMISNEAKSELINQIKKVDIENYFNSSNDKKMIQKILKNVKYLLENNKKILLERNSIKNNYKI